MSKIEIDDDGFIGSEDGMHAEPVFAVGINGNLVLASPCKQVCVRAARILSEARAASGRDAKAMLIKELGLCEEDASRAIEALHTGTGQISTNTENPKETRH